MKKYLSQLRRGWKYDADPETGLPRDDWADYEQLPDTERKDPQPGELVVEYDNGVPRLKIGDGVRKFSELPYMSIDSFILPKQEFVALSTEWEKDTDDRYYQEVEVVNATITPKSKVDLQPTAEQLTVFHQKDLAFVAETWSDEKGQNTVVKVYCVGQVPQNAYTIPATVTEVVTDDFLIVGDTTATPNPRPDWEQTDEKKADYIKNKPTVLTEDDVLQLIAENGGGEGGSVVDQIQADWNQTDEAQLDYIKNKPDLTTYITKNELGDIEAALDAIIAIQESLIPKVKGTFILNFDGTETTYEFEEGMTWSEWCESEYNTIGAHIDEVLIAVGDQFVNNEDAFQVLADDHITPDTLYYLF